MITRLFGCFLLSAGMLAMLAGASTFPPATAHAEIGVIGVVAVAADCKANCDRCGDPQNQSPAGQPAVYKCIRDFGNGVFGVGNCKTNPKGTGSCGLCTGSCTAGTVNGNTVCGCDQT